MEQESYFTRVQDEIALYFILHAESSWPVRNNDKYKDEILISHFHQP